MRATRSRVSAASRSCRDRALGFHWVQARLLPVAVAIVLSLDPVVAAELNDPRGSSALVGASNWLRGTLFGSLATVVAVIAVAQIGFMALTGRIDLRQGVRVVFGCFILFSAPIIAMSFAELARGPNSPTYAYDQTAPIPGFAAPPEPDMYERCPAGWCRKVSLKAWPE